MPLRKARGTLPGMSDPSQPAPPDPAARSHWERVYAGRPAHDLSWYQAEPTLSLALIEAHAEPGASVLDVGGGASVLVDYLLARGYRPGVLDIAPSALAVSKARLGERARDVVWLEADVTSFAPERAWDVWHDRAVFHFLTEPAARAAYAKAAARAVRPGGVAIVAAFGLTGPDRCSGLPTVRYSAAGLARELAPDFELEDERAETHVTPAGRAQDFTYGVLRRRA